jgi:hypothetical protein
VCTSGSPGTRLPMWLREVKLRAGVSQIERQIDDLVHG